MTIEIQRPGVLDVTKRNPPEFIYVKGSEFVDGSIRYAIVVSKGLAVTEIQERIEGLWQPASFKTGANSVLVGTLITLSAAGDNLIATDDDDHIHFHARSSVENGVTIDLAAIVNAIEFFTRVIIRSDDSGEFTGTSISTIDFNITAHLLSSKFYLKTGETAASQPVRIQAWKGTDETGLLIFDQTYPALEFPFNSEIALTLEGFLEFNIGDDTFTKISSDADFSLLTDIGATTWWLAIDFSSIKDDDLLQTTEYVSGDNFDQGDWTTKNRKVFECNITGIQTGLFTDNSDKWNQLVSLPKEYADIADRDADTEFQITSNINRIIRVNGPLSYYILTSVDPTIWMELSPVNGNAVSFVTDISGASITINIVNVWEDITDGGSSLIWALAPSLNNFSLTNIDTGELTYDGLINCGVRLGGSIEVAAMSGMTGVEIGISINGADPTADTITQGFVTPVQLDSVTISPAKVFINSGDTLKLQIRNISDSSNFSIFQAKNVVF